MTIGYGDEVTHGFGLHRPCRGSVSSYPAPLPGEFRQAGVGHIEPRPALGRRHQLRAQPVPRRPSADEPRGVAVGHHAVLRPPEALPFRRLAAPVEVAKQPSLRRAMRSGSMGSPVTESLTTRHRSAALRLMAEIRHDFGRPPGSNVTRRSPGTTRQVSVRPLRGLRSGRSADGCTSSGSILPNGSSTFRLPPSSRSSGEASAPVSQFHGRSGPLRPIHSPPPRRATARWSP